MQYELDLCIRESIKSVKSWAYSTTKVSFYLLKSSKLEQIVHERQAFLDAFHLITQQAAEFEDINRCLNK